MDVLYVTKTSVVADGGGAERRAGEVTSGLAARGHTVTVVSARTAPTMETRTTHGACEVRHVTCAPEFLLDRPVVGFYAPRYTFALLSIPVLARLLLQREYDVVVENMTPYPTLTVVLARLFGVPIVGVAHEFHGLDAVRLYDPVTGTIQLLVQNILRLARFERIIVPSSHTRERFVEYGIPADRLAVIPNGIDAERFQRPAVERRSNTVVTVGRLCHRKGQRTVIEAVERLRTRVPDVSLHVVGDGPLREDLERSVTERSLDATVTFHGFVSEEEKVRLLNEATVFAFGSRQEGFGIALLEAFAAGTPVVARDLPVYHDFFEDGRNGFLVDGTPDQFATALTTLLEADGLSDSIRRSNRATAREFSWERTVERTESTLDAVAGAGPEGRGSTA